jgi:4a-hydroxytetrahydrobiopterin dehydratase
MDQVPENDLRNTVANRLHDWQINGKTLERVFQFPSFRYAIDFVNRVADAADEMNHHPDININYDKVRIALTSHDAGAITYRDLKLAGKIDELAPQFTHPGKLRTA